ncbi:MAG: hypothetical protein M3O89_09795 [Actinomycetota bacterium]|nr:hypothetical protein [Actinomycetota bacterium]
MAHHRHHEGTVARELHHLEQVAQVGESDETPLILLGGVWVVSAFVVLVILVLTLVVARLAT